MPAHPPRVALTALFPDRPSVLFGAGPLRVGANVSGTDEPVLSGSHVAGGTCLETIALSSAGPEAPASTPLISSAELL